MIISVYTFIGYQSAPYAENLFNTLDSLASGDSVINYYCYRTINNHQYPDEQLPVSWQLVEDVPGHAFSNSASHALSLNKAWIHARKSNADISIFCDADIAVTYQNWDDVVVSNLLFNDVFGWSDKLGYPSVFFLAVKKNVLKNHMDFLPSLGGRSKESCKRKIINGRKVKCDTGYQLYYLNLKYNCLPRILGKSSKSLLPYRDSSQKKLCQKKEEHMTEYNLNGELFGTHLQACRSDGIDSNYGNAWIDRINMYLLQRKGVYV